MLAERGSKPGYFIHDLFLYQPNEAGKAVTWATASQISQL
ncbi:hypothetical protein PCH70_12830 [Pseudomonas cichorii JBC1]|nr:hypothetical protein PCH70_12830 [Pseudomonas cichorii JBC1]